MNQQMVNGGLSDPYEPGEVAKAVEQNDQKDSVVTAVMSASWNSFKLASIVVIPTAIFIFISYGARASVFVAAFVYSVWVGSATLVAAIVAIGKRR